MFQPSVQTIQLVTDVELRDPEFIRRVRAFSSSLQISPRHWLDYLLNEFARLDCVIVDASSRPVILRTEIFEPTDADIDAGRAPLVRTRILEWFETMIAKPCPPHIRPRVRRESIERFRIVATLLRALHRFEAMKWNVANDNFPPIPPTKPRVGRIVRLVDPAIVAERLSGR